jgi:hypothetical protein
MVSEILLIKFLIGLLFVLMIYAILTSLEFFMGKKGIAAIIATIVVLVGIRFVSGEVLMGLFLPTSAYILAGSLVLQFVLILYINISIFKGAGIITRMLWYVWAAALLYLLVKYGIWNFIDDTTFLGITKPAYVLPRGALFLYGVAIFVALGGGNLLDKYIAKYVRVEEFERSATALEENLKAQEAKRKAEAASFEREPSATPPPTR